MVKGTVQTARAIANYYLARVFQDGSFLTPMQLLKLVYIAHGWNLAINRRPLIDDPVEAWKYGPVIVDLYHGTKKFGPNPVTEFISGGPRDIPQNCIQEDIRLAEKVLAKYRNWKAFELMEMTHQEGTPWHTVWYQQGGNKRSHVVIPNSLIQKHFMELEKRILEQAHAREVQNVE